MRCALVLSLLLCSAGAEARLSRPQTPAPEGGFQLDRFAALLSAHVDARGQVGYGRLLEGARGEVESLYAAVAAHPTYHPVDFLRRATRGEALAFYLNAYHVIVWKAVLDRLADRAADESPQGVLEDRKLSFYSFTRYVVAGKPVSLDELRRKLVRDYFQDPRLHLVLACGARSCPPFPGRPFQADTVEQQVDEATRRFLDDPGNVEQVPAGAGGRPTLRLSGLIALYRDDLGPTAEGEGADGALARGLSRLRLPPTEQKTAGDKQKGPAPIIEFRPFDWRLAEN